MTTATPSKTKPAVRRRLAGAFGLLPLLLAAFCFYKAVPAKLFDQPTPAIAAVTAPASQPERKLETTPIRDLRVGMRVLAHNPELGDTERIESDIDPATWRVVALQMDKPDGSVLEIELLRPLEWLFAAGATPGGTIHLDLPEMGAAGPAKVLSIGPCPEIEPGEGRVITGTFTHSAGNVIDLHVSGLPEPIGTTDNHPFWTEDRQAFVPAGELRVGENLRTADGRTAPVIFVSPRLRSEQVHNLEVDAEHVYYVGSDGLLVHNQYHHYWTKWLGSKVLYKSPILTNLSDADHKKLHDALRTWIKTNHPDMMYGPGRKGLKIQSQIDWTDRVNALDDFYSQYQGGAHLGAFRTEVLQTLFHGAFK